MMYSLPTQVIQIANSQSVTYFYFNKFVPHLHVVYFLTKCCTDLKF